jgi:hypothetical protein
MNQQTYYNEYEEHRALLRQQKREQEQERRDYEEKHRRHYEEKQRQQRCEEKVKKVSIPPMRYKLTKLTQGQTLMQIAMKTSGFYTMSTRSADWVQRDVRSREFSSFGSYPAPRDRSITNTIIGEDNYYLKLTMKNHDMDYICYDGDKNEFHFWGEYQYCIRAMNEVRYRIEKIQTRMEKEEPRYQHNTLDNNREHTQHTQHTQWPVSRTSPILNNDENNDENNDDDYCPPSPTYDFDFAYDIPVADISYSKVAVNHMQKMGFVDGTGLGSKNSGRLNPLNPVDDLGGRSYNHHHGLGFTGQTEVALAEPVVALAEPVVALDEHVALDKQVALAEPVIALDEHVALAEPVALDEQ